MDITVQCNHFENAEMIIKALAKEGYSVKVEPVVLGESENGPAYYNVTFSNGTDNIAYE